MNSWVEAWVGLLWERRGTLDTLPDKEKHDLSSRFRVPRRKSKQGVLKWLSTLMVLPDALSNGKLEPTQTLAASIVLGCYRFCMSPWIICVFDDDAGNRFVLQLAAALAMQTPHRMLTGRFSPAYDASIERLASHPDTLSLISQPSTGAGPAPRLFEVRADALIGDSALHERYSAQQSSSCGFSRSRRAPDGHAVGRGRGHAGQSRAVRAAERIGGRILFAGVPIGVVVAHAQRHGGPWPTSVCLRTTSVGYAAIECFLRPVAMQGAPAYAIAARDGKAAS